MAGHVLTVKSNKTFRKFFGYLSSKKGTKKRYAKLSKCEIIIKTVEISFEMCYNIIYIEKSVHFLDLVIFERNYKWQNT